MLSLAQANATIDLVKWVPVLPFIAMFVCGLLGFVKPMRQASAAITIAAIAGSFGITCAVLFEMGATVESHAHVVRFFDWINIGNFSANFSFYIDTLTVVMLLVVTGVGLLIAIYAAGYMAGDPGYYRFFAYIGLFIFAMTVLVMADNLLLLYLGWEGVGLASFLLIGFYYRKPSAVAAAKKAFIVNRVGDLGFALGLMATFMVFGSVEIGSVLRDAAAPATQEFVGWKATFITVIPFLLMLGAFGKSAQLPLHVWLPDAMEGPTPVSALIHAATMVTAGVYMIARLLPIFQLSEYALYTVAIVGGVTALFAATIALCQYDIKRIWAYSTISQLGYMFLGVGVLGSFGAIFHLFTHAFFKALLFLTAGSVMHALAGQLDLRKMSGLGRKMPITAVLMLIGCLALAGFPFTAGFYSKDEILYQALKAHPVLGWIGIGTALLTAFYTFRLWFRVFVGETRYEMGREHHGYEVDHDLDDHAHGPHEMGWLMNGPLVILAAGALFLGVFGHDWMEDMIAHSTAAVEDVAHPSDAVAGSAVTDGELESGTHYSHAFVGFISGGGAVVMILLAAYFHWFNRGATDRIAAALRPIVRLLNRKYSVDEIYHGLIVMPLRLTAWMCFIFDRYIIDLGIIDRLVPYFPRLLALVQRDAVQTGRLQSYSVTMVFGLFVILAIVAWTVIR